MTIVESTSTTGSSMGWSTQYMPRMSGFGWRAWVQGVSRSGTAASDAEAQALARRALNALIDDQRRRTTRAVS